MGCYGVAVRRLTISATLITDAAIASCSGTDAASEPGAVVASATVVATRPAATAPASGSAAADAANALLGSLTGNQRAVAVYAPAI